MTLKAQAAKAKIDTWDNIKGIVFYAAEETVSKTERQPTERERMFAKPSLGEGLIISNTLGTHTTQ